MKLQDTIRAAIDSLGQVSWSHLKRFRSGVRHVRQGNRLLSDIKQELKDSQEAIDLFEHADWENPIVVTSAARRRRDHALWSWVTCLPETAKLLRAGRSQEDIMQSFLLPHTVDAVPLPEDFVDEGLHEWLHGDRGVESTYRLPSIEADITLSGETLYSPSEMDADDLSQPSNQLE